MKKKLLLTFGILATGLFFTLPTFAAVSEIFEVQVSIAAAASISLSGGPINFGTMSVNTSSVSTNAVTIKNNGTGSNQTYSLSITNPTGWTAVTDTAPGFNQYRMFAAFDGDGTIEWNNANHSVSTSPTAASATKFKGDQTGTGVSWDQERKLYVKLETPQATNSQGVKAIPVTVTATVD